MRPEPLICTLKSSSWPEYGDAILNASFGKLSFARLTAERLSTVLKLKYAYKDIEPADAERHLLEGRVLIVVATLPPPGSDFEKTADLIFPNESISFMLAHPWCFVLFACWETRASLDARLLLWLEQSDRLASPSSNRHKALATYTPVFWSFITLAELRHDDKSRWDSYAKIIASCARTAAFDPTGFRSFLHFVLRCPPDSPAGNRRYSGLDVPPFFAAVADDERDVAFTHGYHLRRLGYSVFAASDRNSWLQMIEGEWRSRAGHYDAALVDDYMDWEYGNEQVGHNTLDRLPVTHKIYITGQADSDATPLRCVIHKPLLDALDLAREFSACGDGRLRNVFEWSESRPERSSGSWRGLWNWHPVNRRPNKGPRQHPEAASWLKETALTLREFASKIEAAGRNLEAALHFQEAHMLFRSHDHSAAAEAFLKFQMLEIRQIATQHPDIIDKNFWRNREKEIITVLRSTFAEYEAEHLWWTARIFQAVESIMKASLVEGGLIAKIDKSLNKSTFRLQWYQEQGAKWPRWLNPAMWFKYLFLKFSSLKSVAFLWMSVWVAFGIIYRIFSIGCKTDVATGWPLWARSALASLVCGIGIDMPRSVGLCLPKSAELWVGVAQRLIILFIVARLIDLFVTRSRGRA